MLFWPRIPHLGTEASNWFVYYFADGWKLLSILCSYINCKIRSVFYGDSGFLLLSTLLASQAKIVLKTSENGHRFPRISIHLYQLWYLLSSKTSFSFLLHHVGRWFCRPWYLIALVNLSPVVSICCSRFEGQQCVRCAFLFLPEKQCQRKVQKQKLTTHCHISGKC